MSSELEKKLDDSWTLAYFENGKIVTNLMVRSQDLIIAFFKTNEHSNKKLDIVKKFHYTFLSYWCEPISIFENKVNFQILMTLLNTFLFNQEGKGRKSTLTNEEKLRATIEYLTTSDEITYAELAQKYGGHESKMYEAIHKVINWLIKPIGVETGFPKLGDYDEDKRHFNYQPLIFLNYMLEPVVNMDYIKGIYFTLTSDFDYEEYWIVDIELDNEKVIKAGYKTWQQYIEENRNLE